MQRRRQILGGVLGVARGVGWVLIALAIVCLPPLRNYFGAWIHGFDFAMAIIIGLIGILWLIAIELFVRFFDQFLSRN